MERVLCCILVSTERRKKMVDKVALRPSLSLTRAECKQIKEVAKARGYSSVGKYLRALAEADAEALEGKDTVLDDFRQSWHEAMNGQTIPLSELWNSLGDE